MSYNNFSLDAVDQYAGSERPTLDQLKASYEKEKEGRSRFYKSICPTCGALVTNQAMGRKAHMQMHKRKRS